MLQNTLETLAERPNRGALFRLVSAVAFGVILFLVSGNAIAGAVLPSLNAGWSSFSTGLWLLRTDERLARAITCFVFYLATACYQAAAGALAGMLFFLAVEELTGKNPTQDEIEAVLLTLLGAVVGTTLVGLLATFLAYVNRIRVWVHPGLRSKLRGRLASVARLEVAGNSSAKRAAVLWTRHAGFNHAIFVLAISLIFPVAALGCGALIFMISDSAPNDISVFQVVTTMTLVFGGPLAMIPVYALLSARIIAPHPRDCWPEVSGNEVMSAGDFV
jgi:hypothetical protein